MQRCKDCEHWRADGFAESGPPTPNPNHTCEAPLMVKGYSLRSAPPGGVIVEDDESWGIYTDAEFGCVLFEPRVDEGEPK